MKRVVVLISTIAIVATACASATDEDQGDGTIPTLSSTVATATTPEPTTTTKAPSASTDAQDTQEITALYETVFSSDTTYEEKALLIDDPSGLEGTVDQYMETGESMGGVGLVATGITVSGDSAEVTYDLLFGGNPTYPDLTGDAIRVDGTWLVTREMFCSIMTSARVGCPSS